MSRKAVFAEVARLVAIQLSNLQGNPLNLPGLNQSLSLPSLIIPRRLYLGGYWNATNEEQLKALGITHVVSVMESKPDYPSLSEYAAALKTLHICVRDTYSTNILPHLDCTTNYIRQALTDPNSVVLVHCFQGISRSATVVAAYLLASSTEFDSAASVLRFLAEKRSIVSPNPGFLKQLDQYAKICAERRDLIPLAVEGVGSDDKAVIEEVDAIAQNSTLQHNIIS